MHTHYILIEYKNEVFRYDYENNGKRNIIFDIENSNNI